MIEFSPEKEIELSGLFIKLPKNSGILYTNDEDYFNSFISQIEDKGFVINRTYSLNQILEILDKEKVKIERETLRKHIHAHLIKKVDYTKAKEYKVFDSGLRKALNYYMKS